MTLDTLLKDWRTLLLLFLAGSALGWLAGFIFPADYQATADLYVGLTAYRAPLIPEPADARYYDFRNLDDYKNWHLGQAQALLLSDDVLNLANLADARAELTVAWSNAGNWQLSARGSSAQEAQTRLQVWRDTALPWLNARIQSARAALALDIRLQAIATQIAQIEARQAALLQIRSSLEQRQTLPWITPLPPLDLWRLRQVAAFLAQNDPLAAQLMAHEPPLNSQPQSYANWATEMQAYALAAGEALAVQRAALYQSYNALNAEYQTELHNAHAVSPFLSVEILTNEPPQVTRAFSSATAALVGGLLGVLAGGAWIVSRKR